MKVFEEKKHILEHYQPRANYLMTNFSMFLGTAIRAFGAIESGTVGGWVETKANLSDDGNCWVGEGVNVFESTKVYGDALIYGSAKVGGNARVHGNAILQGNSSITVGGNSEMAKGAMIY